MSTSLRLIDVHGAPEAAPQAPPQSRRAVVAIPWATIAVALAVCFVALQGWLQWSWLGAGPTNDFLTFYSAAGATDFYTPDALESARPEEFAGFDLSSRPYLRPPLHAALFAPLRLLPYPSAYQLFLVLMLWSMAAFIAWWLPENRAFSLLFAAISLPLYFAFLRGQDLPIALLAAAAAAHAVRKERPFLAGLCLSLTALHPQALIALPVFVVAQRRWTLGAGLATGLGAYTAGSFAFAGLDWPQRYLAAWTSSEPLDLSAMPNLTGAVAWLGLDPVTIFAASLAVAAATYAVSRREDFATGLGCALAAGLLLAPRAYLEDTVLLLPVALAFAVSKQSWGVRVLAFVLLSPLGFLLQGGELAAPVFVGLSLLLLLLAGLLTPARATARTPRGLVQLRLS